MGQQKGGLRVEKRAKGKWWAVSEPLQGKSEYRGPFDTSGEAEAALCDLVGLDSRVEERADGWYVVSSLMGREALVQGPHERKIDAELLARLARDEMREIIGLPRNSGNESTARMMGGVVQLDGGQENATNPRALAKRPPDFDARLERARLLNERATELEADDLDLLLAAWQRLDPAGKTHHTL